MTKEDAVEIYEKGIRNFAEINYFFKGRKKNTQEWKSLDECVSKLIETFKSDYDDEDLIDATKDGIEFTAGEDMERDYEWQVDEETKHKAAIADSQKIHFAGYVK